MIDTLTDLTTERFAVVAQQRRNIGWCYAFPADELKWFRDERDAGRIITAQRREPDGSFVIVAKMAKAPPPKDEQSGYRWLTLGERNTIRRMTTEGHTPTEIGTAIGRNPETVRYAVKKQASACV